jgi:hypothetical protein
MRNGIFVALAALAFLVGCDEMGNKPYNDAAASKWKPPYHLGLGAQPSHPNPAGVTLPAISYKSDTKEWERRAALVVQFDASALKNDVPSKDRVIMAPTDIPGSGGNLPSSYLDLASKELGKMLQERCMKGTVKISVALVRSSIRPNAEDAEIKSKLLSDWFPAEVVFNNPHPKCEQAQPTRKPKG